MHIASPKCSFSHSLKQWSVYFFFTFFALFPKGESIEENAYVVLRLLIRRPECFGPALRGNKGDGLLAAMKEAIRISEDQSMDGPLPSQHSNRTMSVSPIGRNIMDNLKLTSCVTSKNLSQKLKTFVSLNNVWLLTLKISYGFCGRFLSQGRSK